MSRAKSKTGLDEPGWNFDEVPDEELAACSYWEYARESAFLLGLKRQLDVCDRSDWLPPSAARAFSRVQGAPAPAFLHLDAMLEAKAFPGPWQELPKSHRQRLVKLDFGLPPAFASGGDVTEAEWALEFAEDQFCQYRADEEKLHAEWPGYGEGTLRSWGK